MSTERKNAHAKMHTRGKGYAASLWKQGGAALFSDEESWHKPCSSQQAWETRRERREARLGSGPAEHTGREKRQMNTREV